MPSSAREYDINGWFEVPNNPISRVGVFPYSGAQIGAPASRAGEIFQVFRPPEELGDEEAIASFRLMPIIDDHTMLGDGHTAPEEKGVAGVIGEGLRFDGSTLFANLKVFGKALAEKIKRGKTELSCGYRCVYEFTSGEWNGQKYDVIQRRIRGNHLAVVDEGRMGPEVAILDHMTFTVDAKETAMEEELKKLLEAIMGRLDKLEEKTKVEAEEAEDEEAEAKVEDEETEAEVVEDEEAEAEDEEAEAKAEAMDAQIKALRKQVKALSARPAMDEKTLMSTVAAKSALVARLTPHIGAFDSASMTHDDVAKYGVKKLAIKLLQPGTEAIALDAYLQAAPTARPHVALDGASPTALSKTLAAYASGEKK